MRVESVRAPFLDFSKAFDTVNYDILFTKPEASLGMVLNNKLSTTILSQNWMLLALSYFLYIKDLACVEEKVCALIC